MNNVYIRAALREPGATSVSGTDRSYVPRTSGTKRPEGTEQRKE